MRRVVAVRGEQRSWDFRTVVLLLVAACSTSTCSTGWLGFGLRDGPGQSKTYRVSRGETLLDIAHRFRLGYTEMLAANPGTDPWLPKAGETVVLPIVHLPPRPEAEGILVNLGDMRLYVYESGKPSRSYAIGIGRQGLTTPLGSTSIVRKEKNPSWRPTPRMRREDPELPAVVEPGPYNPLGTRALYLGWPPYAIHGTNKPLGVGRRLSSGCVRMYGDDAEELFELVAVGTKVTIIDEPVKLAWLNGELFMEAHPSQQQGEALVRGKPPAPAMTDAVVAQVHTAARGDAARLDWELIKKIARERRGYPFRVTR